jgi:hypothetical protein
MFKRSLLKRHTNYPLEIFKNESLAKGYLCFICNQILFNPFSDPCGHNFCHDCIITHLRESETCPINESPLKLENIKISLLYINIIENLEVVCLNKNKNCTWEGKFKDLDYHFNKECLFTIIKCKFSSCPEEYERRNLNNHYIKCQFRQVKCKYCKNLMGFADLEAHSIECKNKKIDCFLRCGKILRRKQQNNHELNDCPNFKLNCEYKQFGCNFICKRKEMLNHVQSDEGFKYHISLIKTKLSQLESSKDLKRNSKNNFVQVVDLGNEFPFTLSEMELRSMKSYESHNKSVKTLKGSLKERKKSLKYIKEESHSVKGHSKHQSLNFDVDELLKNSLTQKKITVPAQPKNIVRSERKNSFSNPDFVNNDSKKDSNQVSVFTFEENDNDSNSNKTKKKFKKTYTLIYQKDIEIAFLLLAKKELQMEQTET